MLKDTVKARLTQPVRAELDRLEREVAYYKGLYENAVGQTEEKSRVVVSNLDKPIYLDEAARVLFYTGKDDFEYVEVHLQGDDRFGRSVSVRAGMSQLLVHPSSGNSIAVTAPGR